MSYIRPLPPFELNDAWATQLGQEINRGDVIAGRGIRVAKTSSGTTISLAAGGNFNAMTHRGLYSYASSYNVGDVVFVNPNFPITDQTGSVIPTSQPSGSAVIPICCGLFICHVAVPPIELDDAFLLETFAPAYTASGQVITPGLADTFRHYSLNVYYPFFPLFPSGSMVYVTESSWTTVANQTYWLPLSPMLTSSVCNADGTLSNIFINGVESGSVFQYILPYA